MKFLVDAQLPLRLVRQLAAIGHDAVHTSQLAEGNRTSDAMLSSLADDEGRIVMTKDRDFEVGHLIGGIPQRLLLVTTGNITNGELLSLVIANIKVIADAFENARFIELSSDSVTIRGGPGR